MATRRVKHFRWFTLTFSTYDLLWLGIQKEYRRYGWVINFFGLGIFIPIEVTFELRHWIRQVIRRR